MVLCQFFLGGNCRFGTKCFNDHIDLKQIIRVEIDSAIKGNQWPISCFGPFKDKPCIPNFIEDQSFEEIRYKFYEAKINGNFEQVRLGFINLIQESKSKLQQLNMLSPEIMNIFVQLYDAGSEPNKNNSAIGNNPFATANIGNSQTGNQAQNIFGKSTFATTTDVTATSMFGGTASSQQQSGNIFGGTSFTNPNQTSGIFGGAQPQQSQQSIFGAAAQPNTGVFGSPVNTFQPANAGSQFALPQLGNQQPTQNVFGPGQPTQGIFGSPTQPQPATNIFGGQTIFQQPTQPVQSVFAAPANPPPFGGGQQSIFGQQQVPQPSTPANVFQTQSQQPQQTGIFAQASQVDPNSVQMRNNMFNQPMQQQPQQSAFSQPSPFQQPMPVQQQQQPIQPPPFSQAQHVATHPVPNQPSIGNYYDSCYSKLSELTPEELEAFKSDQFEVGKIPTVPPPKELC